MKITDLKTYCFLDDDGRKYFIVKVETDAGIHGLGEVGITHWGGAVDQAVRHLGDVVIGEDPMATERLWQRMFQARSSPPTRSMAAPSVPSTLPCGTSRARHSGSPCTDSSAAQCATAWCATHTCRATAQRRCSRIAEPLWTTAGNSYAGTFPLWWKAASRRTRPCWTRANPSNSPWSRWLRCARKSARALASASTSTLGSIRHTPWSSATA
ncbi:MAG: hypothetical protein F4Y26_16665 [Gammaproteobacteria bacterium]|nr:hypothetical protein [Gammaproteobacteria bacterium]